MQRALFCVKTAINSGFGGPNSIWSLQVVRWGRKQRTRKPFWLGVAKSKLLKFEKPIVYAPGEEEEIKKLYNDYRRAMKSMYNYFREEHAKTSDTSELAAENARIEQEEHKRLMELNCIENERIAKLREVRVKAELESEREDLKCRFAELEESERERIKQADELIRFYKSQPVITLEELDDAIERAFEMELDYNYAIDLQGNVYQGRHTTAKDLKHQDTEHSPITTELKL